LGVSDLSGASPASTFAQSALARVRSNVALDRAPRITFTFFPD